jgi:uncharacterized membrane protein YozB (DUF420 family)
MVPLGAALAQTGWTWTRMHPAVNAMLNGTSAVFVIAGGIAIKRRKRSTSIAGACWPRSDARRCSW